MQPGAYTKLLMRAIAHADRTHTELLRKAYPALVAAMVLATSDEDGIRQLQQIAAGQVVA